ncbi:outer membrane protein assembly factor BamD [Candidatus Methylacidiphilum infernorum]|uniref:Outer membrane protein assembly factor BamD n=1 Tax=Candidatus Methylacidiphilum infernorum TaxID=511746 RepID=A0ABX7PWP7_9BACT|nr:outer membrane protein assembly factor BamD [Candidatus Methylacidiphilum infernorum]QSR87148.1 outer membrane protein assembly factor BamD [Candidatus Methylacidiphilum infernorum]
MDIFRNRKGIVLFILSFFVLKAELFAPLVWRPGEGWVDESTGTGLSASSSRDQLNLAKKFEEAKDYDNALKAYRILIRKWPYAVFAPEAQFRIGQCLEKKGDFLGANKAYDRMIQKYPSSSFFEQALERKLAIGNLYLAGEPKRLFNIPMGSGLDIAAQIFESIIRAAPYGRFAPLAEFQLGLTYIKEKKYTDAIATFNRLIDKYPNHSLADDAQYEIGYTWYQASLASEYDQSSTEKAIEGFEDYIVRYPSGDKVEAAKAHIAELKSKSTLGSFHIAQFYERAKNFKAAYIYYSDVIKQNPTSEQAKIAQQKIVQLHPLVAKDLGLPSITSTSNPSPSSPSSPQTKGSP